MRTIGLLIIRISEFMLHSKLILIKHVENMHCYITEETVPFPTIVAIETILNENTNADKALL